MRWRNTIIALVCLLLLIAYIRFVEIPGADTAGRVLIDYSAEEIDSVTLSSPERDVTVSRLKTDRGTFALTAPVSWPADRLAASAVFDAAADLTANKSFVMDDGRAEDFGLLHPVRTVTVRPGEGEPVLLQIGGVNPSGDFRYARLADADTVHLVNVYQVKAFLKTLFDLRDTSIFPGAAAHQVQGISLARRGAEKISLDKSGGEWRLDGPAADRADAVETEDFIHTIVALKAESFVDGQVSDLAAYGLDKPEMTVTLRRDKDRPPLRVALGTVEGERYFASTGRDDVLFEIHSTAAADLVTVSRDRLRDRLRDRRLTAITASHAVRLEVCLSGGTALLAYKRDGSGWMADVHGGTVEITGAAAFLEKVSEIRAEAFGNPDDPEPSADRLVARVKITAVNREKPHVFSIYRPAKPGEKCRVLVPGRPAPLLVSETFAAALEKYAAAAVEALGSRGGSKN